MKQVMWDEPEPELSHGTVIRYNVGYKQVCTKANQTKQSRPTSEKERLKALLANLQFGAKSPHQFYDLDRYEWHKTRYLEIKNKTRYLKKLKNDDGTRYFKNINKTRYLKKLEIRRGI